MIHNAHTYAQPLPWSTMHTHTHNPGRRHKSNTCATMYPLLFYSPVFFFRGSEHKRNICFEEKNHSVCKNALERERGYTHTCQGNMVMFFCFFFCFRALQSKSSHIPMTFLGGESYHFSYSHQTNNVLKFLFSFFITYMSYSLHKKIDVAIKGKKLFHSHIHAHTYTLTTQLYPFGLSSPMYRKVPLPIRT